MGVVGFSVQVIQSMSGLRGVLFGSYNGTACIVNVSNTMIPFFLHLVVLADSSL